ncbi:rho-associated protein kinase 1-like [Ambystoma mexicanum]|uniref:rho-associated protein kinase 1-like n=1 Tax=Ambystoma mexicanum TaxID=8296 RepID=UPI0037E728BB
MTKEEMQNCFKDFQDQCLLSFQEHFKSLKEDRKQSLQEVKKDIAKLEERTDTLEKAVQQMEDKNNKSEEALEHLSRLSYNLELQCEDLENRLRRSNIRIRNLPESIEDKDLPETVQQLFTEVLEEDTEPQIMIDRLHRRSNAPNKILGLIKDTGFSANSDNKQAPARRIKQLEYLIRKEINRKRHAITLGRYSRGQRLPRGLRIQLRPTICKESKEFVKKWEAILNKCSLDLIHLTIQELANNLKDLGNEIQEIEKQLVTTLNREEVDAILEDINNKLAGYKTELETKKIWKFRRDTYDYLKDEVYSWMVNSLRKTKPNNTSETSSSGRDTERETTNQEEENTPSTRMNNRNNRNTKQRKSCFFRKKEEENNKGQEKNKRKNQTQGYSRRKHSNQLISKNLNSKRDTNITKRTCANI